MSRIHLKKSDLKIQDLISESPHIVEVTSLDKNEVFNEVHFPKNKNSLS